MENFFFLTGATAAQAPKKMARKKGSGKSAYVKAAHKLLDFAVKEVHYCPEPGEELIDERVDRDGDSEDYFDFFFKRASLNDTITHKDPTLEKKLKDMNKLLPEILEKTMRRKNSGRRSTWWWRMKDGWYEGFIDNLNLWNQTEEYKHALVTRLSLSWYLHARRFIYRSLDMRKPIMHDKRYKIGFLFHALRMNVFDQHKLLQGMQQQEADPRSRNFETTLLVYTKIVRMNVDLNDIISYLRLLHHHQPDPLLKSTWDFEHKQDPKNKKHEGIVEKKKNTTS